ncbi:hypothetical protein DIPPA_00191 [Diplonema papillatum]|nr:hypothetical protein DIPPA_00191 [Diplonema papillatum]
MKPKEFAQMKAQHLRELEEAAEIEQDTLHERCAALRAMKAATDAFPVPDPPAPLSPAAAAGEEAEPRAAPDASALHATLASLCKHGKHQQQRLADSLLRQQQRQQQLLAQLEPEPRRDLRHRPAAARPDTAAAPELTPPAADLLRECSRSPAQSSAKEEARLAVATVKAITHLARAISSVELLEIAAHLASGKAWPRFRDARERLALRADAHIFAAFAAKQQGRVAAAVKHLDKASLLEASVNHGGISPETALSCGSLLTSLGRFKESARCCKFALRSLRRIDQPSPDGERSKAPPARPDAPTEGRVLLPSLPSPDAPPVLAGVGHHRRYLLASAWYNLGVAEAGRYQEEQEARSHPQGTRPKRAGKAPLPPAGADGEEAGGERQELADRAPAAVLAFDSAKKHVALLPADPRYDKLKALIDVVAGGPAGGGGGVPSPSHKKKRRAAKQRSGSGKAPPAVVEAPRARVTASPLASRPPRLLKAGETGSPIAKREPFVV